MKKIQTIKLEEYGYQKKVHLSQEDKERLIEATKEVLEVTPPEILSDIMHRGIYLSGGGALIKGFAEILKEEVKMPVYIADDPLTCVVRGTGIILEDLEKYKEAFDVVITGDGDFSEVNKILREILD